MDQRGSLLHWLPLWSNSNCHHHLLLFLIVFPPRLLWLGLLPHCAGPLQSQPYCNRIPNYNSTKAWHFAWQSFNVSTLVYIINRKAKFLRLLSVFLQCPHASQVQGEQGKVLEYHPSISFIQARYKYIYVPYDGQPPTLQLPLLKPFYHLWSPYTRCAFTPWSISADEEISAALIKLAFFITQEALLPRYLSPRRVFFIYQFL